MERDVFEKNEKIQPNVVWSDAKSAITKKANSPHEKAFRDEGQVLTHDSLEFHRNLMNRIFGGKSLTAKYLGANEIKESLTVGKANSYLSGQEAAKWLRDESADAFTSNIAGTLEVMPSRFQVQPPTEEEPDVVIVDTESKATLRLVDTPQTISIMEIIQGLSEAEVLDFYFHLTEYPMLGLAHETGQKIIKAVKEWTPTAYTELPLTLYRARYRDDGQAMPFSPKQMFDAPYGTPNMGRWNFMGHGMLYTSDNFEGAVAELKGTSANVMDVIEWFFNEKVTCLDMVGESCPLFRYCLMPGSKVGKIEQAYILPNFLAQSCQMAGIQMLRHKSSVYEKATNYTFFAPSESWFKRTNMRTYEV
ncbi:RES family NAD+ phosphorylase [Paenibacillus xylanexedens]|uniref:RES family NAD+ phosphorylase n=1 Tax=Paenibacillus xylanexedens TaxID=528191 RepID=UPI001F2C7923|nr:RES family NAD+ phosphorylase [Paenibacillus xylanexedens]MCF7753162.1 RES family NAD+ phosphorylase [Paenibacillus xylanexedens]